MISMDAESTKPFLKREHVNDNNISKEWEWTEKYYMYINEGRNGRAFREK